MTTKKQVEKTDVYKPMAVPPVTHDDRLEALEAKVKVLEQQITRHEAYHFGKKE